MFYRQLQKRATGAFLNDQFSGNRKIDVFPPGFCPEGKKIQLQNRVFSYGNAILFQGKNTVFPRKKIGTLLKREFLSPKGKDRNFEVKNGIFDTKNEGFFHKKCHANCVTFFTKKSAKKCRNLVKGFGLRPTVQWGADHIPCSEIDF